MVGSSPTQSPSLASTNAIVFWRTWTYPLSCHITNCFSDASVVQPHCSPNWLNAIQRCVPHRFLNLVCSRFGSLSFNVSLWGYFINVDHSPDNACGSFPWQHLWIILLTTPMDIPLTTPLDQSSDNAYGSFSWQRLWIILLTASMDQSSDNTYGSFPWQHLWIIRLKSVNTVHGMRSVSAGYFHSWISCGSAAGSDTRLVLPADDKAAHRLRLPLFGPAVCKFIAFFSLILWISSCCHGGIGGTYLQTYVVCCTLYLIVIWMRYICWLRYIVFF